MSDMQQIDEYYLRRMERVRDPREAHEVMREYQRVRDERYGYGYGPTTTQMLPPPLYPRFTLPGLGGALGAEPASTKPAAPLPEDHIVAAVTAYRAWNVPLFADELRSVAKSHKWLPYQRFEAKCEQAQCQGVSCSCGIYAFNKMDLVQKEYRQEDRSKRYVYGEVALWGRVLECKDGYRAQFAYPQAFVNNGAIAKRMAEVFGVKLL